MHSDSEMVKLRDVVETLIYMTDEDSDGVEEVMQLPTIDIVTCGECKHWYNDADCGMACEFTNMKQPSDGFCNWGERANNTQTLVVKNATTERRNE